MSSHASVAKSVRLRKEANPEKYCPNPRCLWSLAGGRPCPKHMPPLEHRLDAATPHHPKERT